ncbi:hypothetical protein U1737_04430 [Sphingomonas sp. LB3N6]
MIAPIASSCEPVENRRVAVVAPHAAVAAALDIALLGVTIRNRVREFA